MALNTSLSENKWFYEEKISIASYRRAAVKFKLNQRCHNTIYDILPGKVKSENRRKKWEIQKLPVKRQIENTSASGSAAIFLFP